MQAQTTSTHGILRPDAAAMRFELVRRAPSGDLAEFVERHWTVHWRLPAGMAFTQEVLPHPCVNLVTESHLVAVHGIPVSRGRKRLEGSGSATGTKFRPGALTALTGLPAARLVGASLPLPRVFGDRTGALETELASAAGDADAHIRLVERFLRERHRGPDPRFALLREVVADMLVADRTFNVGDFAPARRLAADAATALP